MVYDSLTGLVFAKVCRLASQSGKSWRSPVFSRRNSGAGRSPDDALHQKVQTYLIKGFVNGTSVIQDLCGATDKIVEQYGLHICNIEGF